MPTTLAEARRIALALPGSSEAPHHQRTSFRVAGRIFATAPADGATLNVFCDETLRESVVAAEPEAFTKLFWAGKVVGVTVTLAAADRASVKALLTDAWQRKGGR